MTLFGNYAKVSLLIGLVLASIFAGLILLWGNISAHEYSPPQKWDTSVRPVTIDVSSGYASAILSAANDFTLNTDLEVDYCTSRCGNISHYGTRRMTTWAARAQYYLRGNLIRHATVYWNAHNGPYGSEVANYIARHEMGHVFGFPHVPCSGPSHAESVMVTGCSGIQPATLTAHDRADINNKY